MIGEAKLDERTAQPYMGIRVKTTMDEMPDVIPQLIGETFGWLGQHGVAPVGPPLMRLHVINMEGAMDYEIGVPVASTVAGDERVKPGVLPAGRYASLIYTGVTNGIPASGALIDWAEANGIAWDRYDAPDGDGFASRYESFLMGPMDDPDPAKWDTEVAIKVAP